MKKSNILKRKLSKKELKEINGGSGNDCVMECICMIDGEGHIGLCSPNGTCCF